MPKISQKINMRNAVIPRTEDCHTITRILKWSILPLLLHFYGIQVYGQTDNRPILLDGHAGGKRFDGIGAVSGGGGTSVLLKDYPETATQPGAGPSVHA